MWPTDQSILDPCGRVDSLSTDLSSATMPRLRRLSARGNFDAWKTFLT